MMKLSTTFLFAVPALFAVTAFLLSCNEQSKSAEDRSSHNNAIIEENRKEGTDSWLISVPEKRCEAPEHQFCRRPQIEGYCSQTSYVAGDTLDIFVSTEPASSYT